jgi:hypothetical protein
MAPRRWRLRRIMGAIGGCAVMTAGLVTGTSTASFASTANTVELCSQGNYVSVVEFPDRGDLESAEVNPGDCWTAPGFTGISNDKAKIYGYNGHERFWIANFYFNDSTGLYVATGGTVSDPYIASVSGSL